METTTASSIFAEAITNGFWTVLKMFWWVLPLAVIIKIVEVRLNRKIDSWKYQKRNKRIKGFYNK